MNGTVNSFYTHELGDIQMGISKEALIKILNDRCIKYKDSCKIIDLNDFKTHFIFNDDYKLICADLCLIELVSLSIDGKQYKPEYIKEIDGVKRMNKVFCSHKNDFVLLNENLECQCRLVSSREVCTLAGCIKHEIFIGN